nr:GNAT family N-acetyltransferase [Lacticaseibacillus nasuensis]
MRLGAQVHAVGFYERLGYHLTARPEFLDAGIRHREMALDLTD